MAKSRSKTQEHYFSQYKANKRWESNRKKRLERALKEQPENHQIKNALKGMVYRRKTPTTPQWSASTKRAAQLYKEFHGVFHKDVLSSDPKLQHAATQLQGKRQYKEVPNTSQYSSFFALGARLQGIK